MKINDNFFESILDKLLNFINLNIFIVSLFLCMINFSELIIDLFNYSTLSKIIFQIVLILIIFIINLISIFLYKKKEKKEIIIHLVFFTVCILIAILYPTYYIFLLLPSISILLSSLLKNNKITLTFYILSIIIIIINLIRNNIFEMNYLINYIFITLITTFIFILSLKIINLFVSIINYIQVLYYQNNQLEKESKTDYLTKLLNKKTLYDDLEMICKKTTSKDIMPCLVMIDLDYFKKINDEYGHINGDKALLSLTNMLKKKLQKKYRAYRFGGEEFIVIIKNKNLNEVYSMIDKMRMDFSKIKHKYLKNNSITFSAGISQYSYKKDINLWIEEADFALYQAKDEGRNKVVIYKG